MWTKFNTFKKPLLYFLYFYMSYNKKLISSFPSIVSILIFLLHKIQEQLVNVIIATFSCETMLFAICHCPKKYLKRKILVGFSFPYQILGKGDKEKVRSGPPSGSIFIVLFYIIGLDGPYIHMVGSYLFL